MDATSAAQRRWQRNSAVVSTHPRWRGIRHPELLTLAPTRFSRLDMLPAIERAHAARSLPPAPDRRHAWEQRAAENRGIIAAHPRWHGIIHPERLHFPPLDEGRALLAYERAVRRALASLRESQRLCARIDAVAGGLGHRRWSWSTDPAAAPPVRPRPPEPPQAQTAPAGRLPSTHRPAHRIVHGSA